MYMMVYWKDDSSVYPIVNEDCTIKVFDTLKECDKYANKWTLKDPDDLRVISMDGVKE